MFNPKENLLEQELLHSGLEMRWGFAAIAAGAAVFGAISGHSNAKKNNKRADDSADEQRELNAKIAKLTNEHNAKLDEADRANYHSMRAYSHKSNLKNWQRGKEIQDFHYLNSLKQYQKSHQVGNAQMGLNAQAMRDGIEAEHEAMKESFIQYNFDQKDNMAALKQAYFDGAVGRQEADFELEGIRNQRRFATESVQAEQLQLESQHAASQEAAMIEGLIREGQVQTGQAGKSQAKAQQSNRAELHRHLMSLEGELSGRQTQAAIQMAEINANSELAAMKVGLNIARIDNAIESAEATAASNAEVLRANMESNIRATTQNIKQITLERAFADVNTHANLMIFPERLSYDPMPELPPERVFIDRMEAIPGFVPPPMHQSTWAPLINGIGAGAGALSGADFSKNFLGQ